MSCGFLLRCRLAASLLAQIGIIAIAAPARTGDPGPMGLGSLGNCYQGLRNPPQALRDLPATFRSVAPLCRFAGTGVPELHGAVDVFLCQTAGLGRGCIWFRYASCGGLLRLLLGASCLHLLLLHHLLLGASCLHLLPLRRRSFGLIYGAPDIARRFLAVGICIGAAPGIRRRRASGSNAEGDDCGAGQKESAVHEHANLPLHPRRGRFG